MHTEITNGDQSLGVTVAVEAAARVQALPVQGLCKMELSIRQVESSKGVDGGEGGGVSISQCLSVMKDLHLRGTRSTGTSTGTGTRISKGRDSNGEGQPPPRA